MNMLDTIQDEALYPGHVVRRMLEKAGATIPATQWMELPDAAQLLSRSENTLRTQCARWHRMDGAPVRVRKKGPGKCSHWLLARPDVEAMAGLHLRGHAADPDEVRVRLTGDPLADMMAHLEDVVTREL